MFAYGFPYIDKHELELFEFQEATSWKGVIVPSLLATLMEFLISIPIHQTLEQIHAQNGWESVPYDYGRFHLSYVHRYSLLLSNGAAPFTRKFGEHYENVISIGESAIVPINENQGVGGFN